LARHNSINLNSQTVNGHAHIFGSARQVVIDGMSCLFRRATLLWLRIGVVNKKGTQPFGIQWSS
jgi:hypothetical protein